MINIYNPNGDLKPSEIDAFGGEYSGDVTTVFGVVAEGRQSGHPDDGYTTHIFTLSVWKESAEMKDDKLIILRPVETGREYFSDLPKLGIVKLDVYLNAQQNRAVMIVGNIVEHPEADLVAAQKTLSAPIEMRNEKYGDFRLDKANNVFETQIEWNQHSINLVIDIANETEISDEFETIDALFVNQKDWKEKVDNLAIIEFLPLKNDWLEEDDAKWSADKFISAYELESIIIGKMGRVEFWHDDGGIFGGHSLLIEGSLENGPINGRLVG